MFAEYSITRMRSLNTKALVVWEQGKHQDADDIFEILVKYKANDTEAKFQLCNNLFCIIDAESEEEIELREMLMEQIKDEPATVEYVHNFLTNREEK